MSVRIRRLEPGDDRDRFCSGQPDLDRFFHRFAGQNQFRHHVGVTYIAVEDDAILGSGIGFGLRKDDTQLKQSLDTAIAKVQTDGTVKKLAETYFPGIDVSVKP